jgi:hypothetical protein
MGDSFKSPPRSNDEQWEKVRLIRQTGHIFWHNFGSWPDSLRETRTRLSTSPRVGAPLLDTAEDRA